MTAAERDAARARILPHLTTHNELELAAMMLETVLELRRAARCRAAQPPRPRPGALVGARPLWWARVTPFLLGACALAVALILGPVTLAVLDDAPEAVLRAVQFDPIVSVVLTAAWSVALGALALVLLADPCDGAQ